MRGVMGLFLGLALLGLGGEPVAAQSITGFQPESGAPGTQVQIYGSGFDATAANNTVTIGGASATVDSAKTSVLYATVPSGVSGLATVSVTVSGTSVQASEPFGVATTGGTPFGDVQAGIVWGMGAADWGDYDNDGDLDLVVGGENENGGSNIVVYRNDGSGQFTEAANFPNLRNAKVKWGDYNGDGLLDFAAVGQSFGEKVKVYENMGNGEFSDMTIASVGGENGSLDWGDYNNDGQLDLVVTGVDESDNHVTNIYRNDGNGVFTAIEAGLPGVADGEAVWGDYNADGRLDLVVTGDTTGGEATEIYRNEGGGTFTQVEAGLTGVSLSAADWGDYDSDGDLDLAVIGDADSGPTVTIYRNDGGGTFTSIGAGLDGVDFGAVEWGDYNGDGAPDLAVTGNDVDFNATTKIYENDGGTFSPVEAGLAGVSDGDVSWGDFDGDGAQDLVLMGSEGTIVYRNEGGGAAPLSPALTASARATASGGSAELTWGEILAPDLEGYNVYRDTAPIDSAAGPSGLTPLNSSPTTNTSYTDGGLELGTTYYYRVTAVDTDGNESGFSTAGQVTPIQRIASVSPTSGAAGTPVRIYGSGFATTPSENTVTFGGTSASVDSVTANVLYTTVPSGVSGPVALSVAVGDTTMTAPGRFEGVDKGGGTFADAEANFVGVEDGSVSWGDYNNDGRPDVLITGSDGGFSSPETTVLYRNDGGGTFTEVDAGLADVGADGIEAAAWGDYNGDGWLDLVVTGAGENEPNITIYRNEQDGTFTPIEAGLAGEIGRSVDWGDYNGDGRLDLVVGRSSGDVNVRVYRNEGGGTFTDIGVGIYKNNNTVQWGDYNNDGALDLLVGNTIYRNDGGGAFSRVGEDLFRGRKGDWGDYNGDGLLDVATDGDFGNPAKIYRNEGDGTFTDIEAGLQVANDGGAVKWGDFDADGALDLVVAGKTSDDTTTTVYRNDGGGTFTALDVGELNGFVPGGVGWGDYNGDGASDLLVVGADAPSSPDATLYRSQPNGVATPSGLARTVDREQGQVTLTWDEISIVDLDGYNVYRADGAFSDPANATKVNESPLSTLQFTDTPDRGTRYTYRVTAVDTDGNESGLSNETTALLRGLTIHAVQPKSGAAGTRVRIYGSQFGTTTAGNTVSFGGTEATVNEASGSVLYTTVPSGVSGPVAVTVESDGKTARSPEAFSAVTKGSDAFGDIGALPDVQGGEYAEWGDYDQDGDLDFVVTGTGTIYRNDGDGSFTAIEADIPALDDDESKDNGDAAWGDFDSDGDLDLVVTGGVDDGFVTAPATILYRNNGDDTFTKVNAGLEDVQAGAIAWGDYNQDGTLDLALQGDSTTSGQIEPDRQTLIYRNDGNGTFTRINANLTNVALGDLEWVDFDGDNDLDLMITGSLSVLDDEDSATLYENEGNGSFQPVNANFDNTTGGIDWADYDQDGDLDLAISDLGADDGVESQIYRNDGNGTFTPLNVGLEPGENAIWGDVTGDGRPDLLVGSTAYRNDGSDQFTPLDAELVGVKDLGDFDGDGDLDLLTANPAILRNEAPVAEQSTTVDASETFDFGDTGIDLQFFGVGSSSGTVTVKKLGYGFVSPVLGDDTNASKYRYHIDIGSQLDFDSTKVRIDVDAADGINDPDSVTVYERGLAGSFASFRISVETTYDAESGELVAKSTGNGFREIFLGSEDTDDNPLPVELAAFNARMSDDAVQLQWTTASETGNAGFRVQRRVEDASAPGVRRVDAGGTDGDGRWKKVGSVEGAGTTSQSQNYRFTDGDLPYEADALTYRLKQVDTDGSASYSETITVERSVDEVRLLGTFPNPARQRATVRYALPEEQDVTVRLYDVLGRQVRTVVDGKQEGRHQRAVDVSGLSSGVYFLRLQADGQVRTQKLTVVQ